MGFLGGTTFFLRPGFPFVGAGAGGGEGGISAGVCGTKAGFIRSTLR
jgi:hypothetical protein